jgi:hypothetical protein
MVGILSKSNIIRTFDAAKAVIVESRIASQAEVNRMGESYFNVSTN